MRREKSKLEQTADLAEELSANIGNLAGAACLLRIDLDDSDIIAPIHRQTMATIQTLLEHLEADAERITECLTELQTQQRGDRTAPAQRNFETMTKELLTDANRTRENAN